MELQGKLAVITGASRGIGRALAVILAKSGCGLLLTALEEDELISLREYLATETGIEVASMPADLVNSSDRQCFLDWIGRQKNPPDMLINNAGAGYFGRFASSRRIDIERTLTLNIQVPTLLIREILPVLRKRPQAKIVNISSAISRLPYPGLAVYGAAKGYLSSLSESLAGEFAGSNISVLCFHPGFTETDFMSSAGMDIGKVPKFLVRKPEVVARRIVRAIKNDVTWSYSDLSSRFGIFLAACLPHRIKIRMFKELFWRLPDEA
ncbi:MAG: SDR family NAD(P)-dependent oxidoreductase [Candidatus Zixiibacteriota bacterium]|nr:MAG: SDR family NAD(P)-dependent oxidoreductase [candidate division Zixibacteria bacterium]